MKVLLALMLMVYLTTAEVTKTTAQNVTTAKTTSKPHNIKEPSRPSTPASKSNITTKRNVGGVTPQSTRPATISSKPTTPTPTPKPTTLSSKPTTPTPTSKNTTGPKNVATTKPTAPSPVTTKVATKATTKKAGGSTTVKSNVNTTTTGVRSSSATTTKIANSTASTTKPVNSTASTTKVSGTTAKPANVTATTPSKTANNTSVTPSRNSTTMTPVRNSVKTTTEEATTQSEEEATESEEETTESEVETSELGETTEEETGETTEETGETTEESGEEETTEEQAEETTEEEETTEAPPTTLQYPNKCICVSSGSCSVLGGNSTSNSTEDGEGNLDPRIVNPAQSSNQTTGTNSSIASVASTGVPLIAESQTNCQFWNPNLDVCCPANGYQCGTVFPPMPGSSSLPGRSQFGQFPWQGIIFTSNDVFVGTGVLIDQQNFLTVAYRVRRFRNSELKVRMGDWDTSSQNEQLPYMEFKVLYTIVHENYTASNLKNNIAILRLEKNVPLGRYPTIATACLSMTDITGLRCFVSGWGRNDFSYGSNQAVQRFVDIPIVNKTQCQATLRMTRLGNNFILDPGFMCAGGEPGKDACTGDGGAPLVCQVVSQWYVVGLVSWGIGCGTNIPGVYTDVNYYLPWIQSMGNA